MGDRRLEVHKAKDGRVVLYSIGGSPDEGDYVMPVGIRMTEDETRQVIKDLQATLTKNDVHVFYHPGRFIVKVP